jgi:hypothetical protein
LRRRRRVFGGSPAAARRALSACRASQAARMRWLRTIGSTVVNSIRGGSAMRRHQPREAAMRKVAEAQEAVGGAPNSSGVLGVCC